MSTPELYRHPQIDARGDGLCPCRLPDKYTASIIASEQEFIVPIQTTSKLLNNRVLEKNNASDELEFICESISTVLMDVVDEVEMKSALVALDFDVDGCIWTMGLNPSLDAPGLQIKVKLLARDDEDNGIIWVAQTYLMDTSTRDKILSKVEVKELTTAKAVLQEISLMVRKAVLKCEFPEFPEGCKGREFKKVYKLNAKLKTGVFSTICRGTHRVSGSVVAIKCVRRNDLPVIDDAAVYDEISILSSLGMNPPRIVPLIDFFEEDDTYFMVKELLTGGNTIERIAEMGYRYSEMIARGIIFNIMEALSFCHSRKVAHRDVNPKNLMFISEDKDRGIKLSGFGLAIRCHAPMSLKRQCGTPLFVAPEVLMKRPYGMEIDLWAAGCVSFLLLSGDLPFSGASQKDLFRSIIAGEFELKCEHWAEISSEGRQFVKDLLRVNPSERLDAKSALYHPWMNLPESELNPRILEDASLRIRDFHRKMNPKE